MSDEKTRAQQQFELEFEEFLRDEESRLAELYRKLPLAAPDAELDARVRALAQRELALTDEDNASGTKDDAEDANLTPTRMYLRHPRWLSAFGAAALVVLAAGIAWRMAPSGWTARERVSLPAAAAPASTAAIARSEQKAKLDSGGTGLAANALRESAVPQPAAATAPPAVTAPSQPGVLAKALSPPAEPVRAKAPSDAPVARPEQGAQAFPAAPALKQVERRQSEKVENAASAASYVATPPPPAPPPPTAAPAVAAEAAPAVAQSPRVDELSSKQAMPQRAAAPAGATLRDAAQAPKSAVAPQPSGSAGVAQSLTGSCPASQSGNDWRGHYPPEIPPTPLLRRQVVKDLIGQAHREEARSAYADFRARCPSDSWPPDILNQLQAQ